MSGSEGTIPYESQSDPQTTRMCGAACLSMVYGSFGRRVAQAEIWPAIAKANRAGGLASTTHLMARDALNRGLSALAIQARRPLAALRVCRDSGIRAIVNLRLKHDAPTGHYAVLVDLDDREVVLHDPYFGPGRRLSHVQFLELWQPRFPDSEIGGHMLIGVAAPASAESRCRLCQAPIPLDVECPKCGASVRLQPGALLGCMRSACAARIWSYVCCPSCDFTWTVSPPSAPAAGTTPTGAVPTSAEASRAPAADGDPLGLDGLFRELDKFCRQVLDLPGAASHPDVKAQIDFIAASKEKLRLAQAEGLAHARRREEDLVAMMNVAKQEAEAHRKRVGEINRPSPPLDGNALGRALLKTLGFTG